MTCPACGRDNPSDAEYCGNCGSGLSTGPEGSRYRPFDASDARSSSMVDRMFAAARLDVQTYEDIEADPKATVQAVWVVVIVSVASGIGLLGSGGGFGGLFLGVVLGITQWVVWAFITYWIGTGILRTPETHATWSQLARTTGFAQSPGVLRVLGFIPVIGPLIFVAVSLWQFVAMVVAVRQALDYESTWRAVGVVVIGFAILFVVAVILILIFGGFA
jgi:hypothetical protein